VGSKGKVLPQYGRLSPQDQATLRRWLRANAVVGSLVAAGLTAMVTVGPNAAPSGTQLVAGGTAATLTALTLQNPRLSRE